MPDTTLGLVIAALIVLPGIVFNRAVTRRRPGESFATYSPRVLALGLVALLFVIFAVIVTAETWSWLPGTRVSDLVGPGASAYVADNTRTLVVTAASILVLSTAVAYVAGTVVARRPFLRAGPSHYAQTSPWWVALAEESKKEGAPYAYVDLRDGSRVGGLVTWYSTSSTSYAERDLVVMPWRAAVDVGTDAGKLPHRFWAEQLFGPSVHKCDEAVRVIVPGDQIARVWLRYLNGPGVAEIRPALEKWSRETGGLPIQVGRTMGTTLVAFGDKPFMWVRTNDGIATVDLRRVRRKDRSRYTEARNALAGLGGRQKRWRRSRYEIATTALLRDDGVHEGFGSHVLTHLARCTA